jgi:tellurite resistance-related uncharacterized protein
MVTLEIGKIYLIEHSRKGNFLAKVLSQDDEWATVEVVKGHAEFMASGNSDRGLSGDQITIRKSFCVFRLEDSL